MKEEEIIEGNRLIAEFEYKTTDWDYLNSKLSIYEQFLNYHSDWNDLMDIVQTIVDRCGFVTIDEMDEKEYWVIHNLTNLHITSPIQWIWKAVVNYIKWYNENETRKKI